MTPMRPLLSLALVGLLASPATGQERPPRRAPRPAAASPLAGLDAYVTQALRDWEIPGLAIAVVNWSRPESAILFRSCSSTTPSARTGRNSTGSSKRSS